MRSLEEEVVRLRGECIKLESELESEKVQNHYVSGGRDIDYKDKDGLYEGNAEDGEGEEQPAAQRAEDAKCDGWQNQEEDYSLP